MLEHLFRTRVSVYAETVDQMLNEVYGYKATNADGSTNAVKRAKNREIVEAALEELGDSRMVDGRMTWSAKHPDAEDIEAEDEGWLEAAGKAVGVIDDSYFKRDDAKAIKKLLPKVPPSPAAMENPVLRQFYNAYKTYWLKKDARRIESAAAGST